MDDASFFMAEFANGVLGSFEVSRFAPGRKNYNTFEIYGSEGSIVFNLERMNELQVFSRNDPAYAQGFRTVLATEAGQHDYIANWWPPGHMIGYEHEFHHAVVDFMHAIETGGEIRPNFYDGLAEMQVLGAAAESAGFTTVIPPALVRPRAMEGTGFLGQAADDVYRIEGEDMYLVGTSEVPLAAYHSDEILDSSALPLRYAAFSPCYRKEAGSYGKDTRGIIRVHWFDKVEMFSFCAPEDAAAEHLRLLQWEEEFLQALELPYRVVDIAAGDLGTSAARKYDIEAWFPTQGTYRELTSTSDCTTFQARRLNIRYKDADGKNQPAATLNGTLCAIARTIACLLEVHQRADGSVHVPEALRPYLAGRTELLPL